MRKCKAIIFFLNLFIFFILTSCSSLLTIGTATFLATSWYDSRTVGIQLDDSILKINIYQALQKNEKIKKNTRIISTVYQGNVLLVGQSPSLALSQEVVKIVSNIQGVQNIYNAIRLHSLISFRKIFFDSVISNQIRLNLFIQRSILLSKIKVVSENREVFLLGKITEEEGIVAKKIANSVYGTKNTFILPF